MHLATTPLALAQSDTTTISDWLRDAAAATPEHSPYVYAGASLAVVVVILAFVRYFLDTRVQAVVVDPNDPSHVVKLRHREPEEVAPRLVREVVMAVLFAAGTYLLANIGWLLTTGADLTNGRI